MPMRTHPRIDPDRRFLPHFPPYRQDVSLDVVVAAPFRQHGREQLQESEFVVALSLDRDWFSPDQATRVVDLATGRGLLTRTDDLLVAEFDPDSVEIPTGFVPDESILQAASPFERILQRLVDAGLEKRVAVADINRLQQDLAVTVEAAAVLYARRHGLDIADIAATARASLSD